MRKEINILNKKNDIDQQLEILNKFKKNTIIFNYKERYGCISPKDVNTLEQLERQIKSIIKNENVIFSITSPVNLFWCMDSLKNIIDVRSIIIKVEDVDNNEKLTIEKNN